jgi:nonsense-mediated mRNA decay protein 3
MNCPTCSRSSKDCRFVGDFCEFCAIDIAKRQAPASVEIEQCRLCGRIRLKGVYQDMDGDSIRAAIESEMKMRDWNVEVVSFTDKEVLVRFYYGAGKEPISFEKGLHLKVSHRTCTDCFRKSSGYYEAIVQLRGNADRVERESGRIGRYMQSRGAFVSKVEKIEGGSDVYLSSKALANEFFMQRKLKPKKSFTLYGMKNGKRLYRNTYFLRV